jgi:hypothetical protein
VELRVKPPKSPNPNSPQIILFVKQRKFLNSPKNPILHLVTQFSVCLRVFPFSEPTLKNPIPKFRTISGQKIQISPFLAVPIIKGRRADSY